jgi:hypothetical protein
VAKQHSQQRNKDFVFHPFTFPFFTHSPHSPFTMDARKDNTSNQRIYLADVNPNVTQPLIAPKARHSSGGDYSTFPRPSSDRRLLAAPNDTQFSPVGSSSAESTRDTSLELDMGTREELGDVDDDDSSSWSPIPRDPRDPLASESSMELDMGTREELGDVEDFFSSWIPIPREPPASKIPILAAPPACTTSSTTDGPNPWPSRFGIAASVTGAWLYGAGGHALSNVGTACAAISFRLMHLEMRARLDTQNEQLVTQNGQLVQILGILDRNQQGN